MSLLIHLLHLLAATVVRQRAEAARRALSSCEPVGTLRRVSAHPRHRAQDAELAVAHARQQQDGLGAGLAGQADAAGEAEQGRAGEHPAAGEALGGRGALGCRDQLADAGLDERQPRAAGTAAQDAAQDRFEHGGAAAFGSAPNRAPRSPRSRARLVIRKPSLHVLQGLDLLVAERAAGAARGVELGPAVERGAELVRGRRPEHRRGPAQAPHRRLHVIAEEVARRLRVVQ